MATPNKIYGKVYVDINGYPTVDPRRSAYQEDHPSIRTDGSVFWANINKALGVPAGMPVTLNEGDPLFADAIKLVSDNPYEDGVVDLFGEDEPPFFDAHRFTCGILEVLCVVWLGWATLAYWNGWDVLP